MYVLNKTIKKYQKKQLITREKPTLIAITRYQRADYSQTPLSLRLTHGAVKLYWRYDRRTITLSFHCNDTAV